MEVLELRPMKSNLAMLNVVVLLAGAVAVAVALMQTRGTRAATAGRAGNVLSEALDQTLRDAENASPYDYSNDVQPLLEEFCYDCHGDGEAKADLALDEWESEEELMRDRRIWKQVMHHVGAKVMPPPKKKNQPTDKEREIITTWIDREVFFVDCSKPDPGRVTIRRLNRQEYNNTIRDLLGVSFEPAADFPPDDTGYGFDNIGDVLTVSPVLLEKYLAAAENVMDQAIRTKKPSPLTKRYGVQQLAGGSGGGSHRVLSTNGQIVAKHQISDAGEYVVRVKAGAHQAGNEPARMRLSAGGTQLGVFDVINQPDSGKVYERRLKLARGRADLVAEFINDYYDPKARDPQRRDRNLLVEWIEISGPTGYQGPPLPKFHREWLPANPESIESGGAAREIIEKFATRAFRRPLRPDEVERLMVVARDGAKGGGEYAFERGVKLALVAVLVSPNFLFRNEIQPNPNDPTAVHRINEHALASRLSYFLWSSMPDGELFRHARAGTLRKNWDAQVRRMLADPKSQALTENFAGQWLQLRDLALVNPDRSRFGEFDDQLRQAMREETELFFEDVVKNDRSILEFLRANYTFLNERLASHYGIGGVKGDEFRRVSLEGSQRGGVFTHGSVLTITSNPTRTSPVKRGKWILDNLLGTPPPEAPANVPPLDSEGGPTGSIRERLEQHRADPNCAACHALMDPIGLALENFDAIGRWRIEDEGGRIDPRGTLDSGEEIDGVVGLRRVLVEKQSGQFTRAMSEAMLTYALGRGLEYYDRCAIDKIVGEVGEGEHRFSSLVLAITRSVPFQMRRGDGEQE